MQGQEGGYQRGTEEFSGAEVYVNYLDFGDRFTNI